MNDSDLHALKENYADMIVDGMDKHPGIVCH